MLKFKKSKVKLGGAVFLALLFCISYIGMSFYSVPEQASAVTWFPQEETRTLADITYLQEMNINICNNTVAQNLAQEFTLKDIRDDNSYTVKALADSKCWMTQNLRLTRETIQAKDSSNTTGKVTSADTNTDSGYTIPPSTNGEGTAGKFNNTTETYNGDTYYTNQQVRAATDNDYGAYYSYNVATLNKVLHEKSGTAPHDICPKGWRLPAQSDFQALYNNYPNANNTTGWTTVNGKAGRWLGAANATSGGAFFPAAGLVNDSGPGGAGSGGRYWSSTILDAAGAYYLDFASSNIHPASSNARYLGYSVRCVANESILESENLSGPKTSETGSIAVKVANTLSIDAVSGMEEEVDSTSVASGTIAATIAANTNYKVLLSAEKTSLISANSANTAEIPASSTVTAGTNAWGIRNSDNTTYSAITNQEKEYHNTTTLSTNPDIPGTVHTFNIGISVSPSLPADTYSTEVTITAAAA